MHADRISLTRHGSPIAGESYILQCSAGESQTIFEWLLGPPNGRIPLANSSSLTITFNSSSSRLQFRPLQQSHNGSYSCSAVAGDDTLLSQPIQIHVKGILYICKKKKGLIIVHFSFQLPLYPSKSQSIPAELQGKV